MCSAPSGSYKAGGRMRIFATQRGARETTVAGSASLVCCIGQALCGDPRVLTLLKELLRVKAVRRLPDGKLEVLSRTFVTARWDNAGIEMVGDRVRDLLDTLVYNLKHPSSPRYARFIVNSEVDPRYVPLLLRDITQQSEVLADTFQDALNDPERIVRPTRSAQDAHRISIGIFVTEEPTLVTTSSDSAPPPAKHPRKAG